MKVLIFSFDQIPAEILKMWLTEQIRILLIKIRRTEKIPEDWIPLHKKKKRITKCKKYRGLTLLSTVYKILSNVLL